MVQLRTKRKQQGVNRFWLPAAVECHLNRPAEDILVINLPPFVLSMTDAFVHFSALWLTNTRSNPTRDTRDQVASCGWSDVPTINVSSAALHGLHAHLCVIDRIDCLGNLLLSKMAELSVKGYSI
jgi:hypothetical protein